jgi:hypothetical protein
MKDANFSIAPVNAVNAPPPVPRNEIMHWTHGVIEVLRVFLVNF